MKLEIILMPAPREIALISLRLFTGFLFFFQGYDKIFGMRLKTVFNTMAPSYISKGVPANLVWAMVIITSYIELSGGALLILGLFILPALSALSLDLILVTIGLSFLNPVWDLKDVFPRFVGLIALLLLLPPADFLSLDHWLF